ncbi:MAG: hypothetical protein KF901_01435 [Myxococcales bacterium]|nr:hypothetical protein [Myxococcales bacterium]
MSRALAARGHELVPARDLAAARRLVDGRRWEPRGPICAASPPLPALLAAQHPTLLLAEVRERLCGPEPEPPPGVSSLGTRCSAKLEVRFRALDPRTPAPTTLEGQLDGSRPAHLLAAARRLEEVRMVGILGVLRSGGGGSFGEGNALGALGGGIGSVLTEDATSSALGARHALRVAGLDGPGPFVSPGSALYARGRELRTCFAGAGIGAFPVSFTIDASGAPTAVVVEHGIDLEGSDEARERARACVERVVSTLRFTCPRAGAADVSGHICIGG